MGANAIQERVMLAGYTSWLVGGVADHFAMPLQMEDLEQALLTARHSQWPVTILGGGTNVLISDRGVRGLTLCLRKLSGIEKVSEEDGYLKIVALAGTPKAELLKIFLKHKLAPALFLAGLPGDCGGGIVMNAGVSEAIHPREFMEMVEWIEVLPIDPHDSAGETSANSGTRTIVGTKLSIIRKTKDELQWRYRKCTGWQPGVIVRIGFSWPLMPQDDILAKVRDANKIRLSKQPLSEPSCGSVFVNPEGQKAGALIEQSGLKGFRIGDAMVSLKHSNFIVNLGHASALNIHDVIEHVRAEVMRRQGVHLHTEVVYLGEW